MDATSICFTLASIAVCFFICCCYKGYGRLKRGQSVGAGLKLAAMIGYLAFFFFEAMAAFFADDYMGVVSYIAGYFFATGAICCIKVMYDKSHRQRINRGWILLAVLCTFATCAVSVVGTATEPGNMRKARMEREAQLRQQQTELEKSVNDEAEALEIELERSFRDTDKANKE